MNEHMNRDGHGVKPQGERSQGNDKARGERRPFEKKPEGERHSFDRKPGGAPRGEGRSFERKPEGERRSFDRKPGDAPRGDGRSFERKPEGEHRSFDRKPAGAPRGDGRSFERKPEGERRSFDRKPADAPRGEGRSFERKPEGERRSFDRKPGGAGNFDRRRTFDKKKADAPKSMNARKLALSALCDVTISGAYSNIALDKRLREATVLPEDKRLATNIFYTALENRMYIDYLLGQFIERMPDEQFVRELLHVAAVQILYMDRVPDYAAVDEAVNQIKAFGREHYAPMINGALRNLIRARDADELRKPDRSVSAVRYLSIMHSLPEPMVARLIAAFGEEMAEQILSYKAAEHWESIRPNVNELTDADFEKLMTAREWNFVRGVVPHSYHVLGTGDLPSDPDYRAGNFSIQGESSMLAAMAVGAKPGMNIIDACAAPGGKSALMCELMRGSGRVYAYELHEHRVELIKKTAARLRLYNMRPIEADATRLRPENEGMMDAVLLDAPCSGLGVMHNKPDLKYRLHDEDIMSLVATQKKLLDTCCRYVKPGGAMVYSTCTLLPDENQEQIRTFLERHPDFKLDADDSWLPDSLKPLFEGGMIQLLAHRDRGMDGFFIAKLRRAR